MSKSRKDHESVNFNYSHAGIFVGRLTNPPVSAGLRKLVILMLLLFVGISSAMAENQRYVVSSKEGKARVIPVEQEGENWKYIKGAREIYLENGTEFEGFEIHPDKKWNYKGSPYISRDNLIIIHEGKHYLLPLPEKNIKPVDENGETTADLGVRNYLSNSWLGDFYRTWTPGLIALICAFISVIFWLRRFFKEKVSCFVRYCFAIPVCIISLLEIGAAFSLGTDAAWWVNPEDVGYWIATPLLIPYSLVAVLMVFSYKEYLFVGQVNGVANIIITVLLIIGTILTVISIIFVVINFLFAACLLIGAGWMFSGINTKDNDGGSTNFGPLGTYKTDKYGNTKRID
ncbi:MAG: hypothetical protein K2G67_02175 [Muribaculaceae bacterium]|nr:hypothetical protein [Muribaculaceae bacterium]